MFGLCILTYSLQTPPYELNPTIWQLVYGLHYHLPLPKLKVGLVRLGLLQPLLPLRLYLSFGTYVLCRLPLCKFSGFRQSSVGAHGTLCALHEYFKSRIHLIHTSSTHECECTGKMLRMGRKVWQILWHFPIKHQSYF